MKRVDYKTISIKNFLSIGKTPVVVEFKKGIHIITGVNRDKTDRKNGVGKSTIADAFYFAHFGETIRNIKKELIVNDVTNDTTEVILDVDITDKGNTDCYQIVRNLKPSKVTLFKNSVDITLDTMSNTTSFFCDATGQTPSIMTNCVAMTLNDTTPFMAKGKPEKRKFIEDVFDLEMFGKMLTLLKKDFSETKRSVEVKRTQVEEIRKSVMTLKEQHEKLVVLRGERIAHYEKRKADNIAERDKLNDEIRKFVPISTEDLDKQVNRIVDAVDRTVRKRNGINDEIIKLEIEKERAERDIEIIKANLKEGTCPACLRSIDECDKAHFNKLWNDHQLTIDKNTTIIVRKTTDKIEQGSILTKLSTKIEQVRNEKNKQITLREEQKTRTKRLELIDGWIKELDQDIASAKSSTQSFTDTIITEVTRLRTENATFAELQEKFKILESTKFILGDEGVKTHIIKKLIDLLNNKLTTYIRKLDGNCICKFNEYFEEEIINNKKKVRSYFNFSGAEKKAVDLACLFSFSDIKRLQGGVSYNVSIYDELFDTSLDETGVSHVINILNERVEENNECVLIISHRKEAIKAVTGDIIYLEKRNDITKRVDYDPSLN